MSEGEGCGFWGGRRGWRCPRVGELGERRARQRGRRGGERSGHTSRCRSRSKRRARTHVSSVERLHSRTAVGHARRAERPRLCSGLSFKYNKAVVVKQIKKSKQEIIYVIPWYRLSQKTQLIVQKTTPQTATSNCTSGLRVRGIRVRGIRVRGVRVQVGLNALCGVETPLEVEEHVCKTGTFEGVFARGLTCFTVCV